MTTILLLDDDPRILHDVAVLLEKYKVATLPCSTVDEALSAVQEKNHVIDFAIVDLFLLGAHGDQLSNSFIRDYLEPGSIPYGRLTSATSLVPKDCEGEWVLDKRLFYRNEQMLIDHLSTSGIL